MSRDGGFSLLETLVGLTLIALVSLIVTESLGTGIFAARRAEDKAAAMSAARSVLAELGVSRPLQVGEDSGSLGSDGSWIASVSERARTDLLVSLDIRLEVSLGGAEVSIDAVKTFPVEVAR